MSYELAFLSGGGMMGERARTFDWASTTMGTPETWPQSLKTAVSIMLNTKGLGTILWGSDLRLIYNDLYAETLADRHPAALGQPMMEVWGETTAPMLTAFQRVMETGEGYGERVVELPMVRGGEWTTTWWDATCSPIRGEDGNIVGLFNLALETTAQIAAERRSQEALAERDRLISSLADRQAFLAAEQHALATLNRAATSMAGELDLDRLVQTVTDAGVTLTGAEFGAFFYNVLDPQGESYMLYTLSGVDRAHFENFPMPRNTAVFAPTFGGAGIVRSADILLDERYGRNAPHAGMPKGHLPVRSYLAAPVKSRSGEVIGGLFFGHPKPDRFDDRHEASIAAISAQAAIAIDNSRLFAAAQRDLEERRAAEARLQELNETLEERIAQALAEREQVEDALRQAQKMEAVGQLTGGLAHDFNNLLTGMMGNLELLQARVARGRLDDLDRFINAAQGAGRRAASLTQRLLAFSRRQTLDPKPTDVNRLLLGLEELLRRTVGATTEIEIVQAAGLWTVDIDAAQLENAVLNLCINGRDAMPNGGKLTIETANKWIDDRTARERDLTPGQYISVCVTDTGSGMSPETIARAFEPFFTTKPLGQGTGLGLSMIYGFARQSGGQVRIYSEPGAGTTVCVYLPRHHGDAADGDEEERAGTMEEATGQTVLVVDDEATIRHLIDEVLDDLGYTVIGAADGAAGLKVLQSGARIELLITDVGLPNGMNGRQVADAARELRPGLKVLFITGFAENAAVGNGHLEPGMELLTKPFLLDGLARKVAEMLK